MKKLLSHAIIISLTLGIFTFTPDFLRSNLINSAFGEDYSDNPEIVKINNDIQAKKDRIKKMQDKQEEYARAIAKKQSEKINLSNELAILDNRLAKAELDIESAETEIDRVSLEIRKTDVEINEKNEQIEREKTQISSALRLIYKQDLASTLEILLLNDSLSEFLNQAKYLEDVNKEVAGSLEAVKKYKEELDWEKIALVQKNKELAALKIELDEKKEKLDDEKQNKFFILEQTNLSENRYQKLLSQAKQEQLNAASEISSLEKTMREKMEKLSNKKLEFNSNGMIWPVPKNTITALFHDPDYPFRNIFEHPAIDIRAKQGTPVRAAASGYVARAKNSGMGYSYIMLIHGDGLSTVYGHISKIYVQDDDYVTQGQVIGLSGGLPGTPGAGKMTTGSHLHLEVRLNGIPVDPESYLP